MNSLTYLKRKYWRWKVNKGIAILEGLDEMMIKANYKRHERRRFWREFVKKQANRIDVYEKLKGIEK